MIIQCNKCGANNRVADIPSNKRPICGRCKEPLNCAIDATTTNRNDPQKKTHVLNVILVAVIIIIIAVICLAPLVMGNNYSNLIASENEKVRIHEEKLKKELADYENTMKSELDRVNPEELHAEAFNYYKIPLLSR